MSAIYVDDLARLLVALAADRGVSIGQVYEPDDGRAMGWTHRSFARAVARAVGRQRLATLATPTLLLKAGGQIDKFVRRNRAKLTPDRARYIAHPDWVATEGATPPADLWHPGRDTEDALAETVRWYRREGWL
jgi:nucleoside-diphosphate-sugar epimerase